MEKKTYILKILAINVFNEILNCNSVVLFNFAIYLNIYLFCFLKFKFDIKIKV